MNKFIIFFAVVAVAAVALATEEQQAPSAAEYDVYSSNGDNLEDAARPQRSILLAKKLLIGKALALKKGKIVLGGAAALGGGALLAKKFSGFGSYGAPVTTYHHYAPAPVHYVSAPIYEHAHYYDDHHHDHHFDHHFDHDVYHGDYHHGWH